jgi:hypothetical protein
LHTAVLVGGTNTVQSAGLGIDSQNLYVPDLKNNRVLYCPLSSSSCSPGTAMNVTLPTFAYSDGAFLWVAATGSGSSMGTISKCMVGSNCGGSPTTIGAGQSNPESIVTDDSYVYWTNLNSGQVIRCAIGGCQGTPTILANVSGPHDIAGDATAIYWADNDGIKKLAK